MYLSDSFVKERDERYTMLFVWDTKLNVPPWDSGPFLLGPQEPDETALHLAVRSVDRTSLHIVDFLVQNRWVLDAGGVRFRPLVFPGKASGAGPPRQVSGPV